MSRSMPRSERSAVAVSRSAGAEHQVREGQRVDRPCRAAPRRRAPGRASGRRGRRRRGSRARRAGGAACRTRPSRSRARSSRTTGWQAIHIASIRKRSCSPASRTISSASAVSRVSGFSQSTCLPASKHSRALLEVEGVRRGDVDDVDRRVGHQLLVGAVGGGRAVGPGVLCGEGLRALEPPGAHRGQARVGHQGQVAGERVRDLARREDAPADGLRSTSHGRRLSAATRGQGE